MWETLWWWQSAERGGSSATPWSNPATDAAGGPGWSQLWFSDSNSRLNQSVRKNLSSFRSLNDLLGCRILSLGSYERQKFKWAFTFLSSWTLLKESWKQLFLFLLCYSFWFSCGKPSWIWPAKTKNWGSLVQVRMNVSTKGTESDCCRISASAPEKVSSLRRIWRVFLKAAPCSIINVVCLPRPQTDFQS